MNLIPPATLWGARRNNVDLRVAKILKYGQTRTQVGVDIFNLLNAADSDIDYYYVSRLPGEPVDGVADVHTHPTLPRTLRVSLHFGF